MAGVSAYPSTGAPLLQPVKSGAIQQLCEPQRRLVDSLGNKLLSSVSLGVPSTHSGECRTLKGCSEWDSGSCRSGLKKPKMPILQTKTLLFCRAGVCTCVFCEVLADEAAMPVLTKHLLLLIEPLSSRRMHIHSPTSSSVLSSFSEFPHACELQE